MASYVSNNVVLHKQTFFPTVFLPVLTLEEEVSVDQVHMDYISTTDKGVEKSIKATYPVKENLAMLQNSVIPKTIRDWTTSAQANSI